MAKRVRRVSNRPISAAGMAQESKLEGGISPADLAKPRVLPKKLNLDNQTRALLLNAGKAQFGVDELAGWLGVAIMTVRNFFQRCPEARDIFDAAKMQGRGSLRAVQMRQALAGDVQMLKWLGKQYLGQKDVVDITAKPGAEVTPDEARNKLLDLVSSLNASEAEGKGSSRLN